MLNSKLQGLKGNLSQANKPKHKKSSIGIFMDLDSKNPTFDMNVYTRVLNQQLNKSNNQFLQEKYKAYCQSKRKSIREARRSNRF
mmetsp:Transcript_22985/g.22835  ORF Transcript_22985/g.22835 Transcript_22985/m.22835 type:complete len:85 (-) Transcript_22985:13-267(-)